MVRVLYSGMNRRHEARMIIVWFGVLVKGISALSSPSHAPDEVRVVGGDNRLSDWSLVKVYQRTEVLFIWNTLPFRMVGLAIDNHQSGHNKVKHYEHSIPCASVG